MDQVSGNDSKWGTQSNKPITIPTTFVSLISFVSDLFFMV